MKRSEAIKAFLNDFSPHPFREKYNENMEVQVNVIQDGLSKAFSFRMPKGARDSPVNNDKEMLFDLRQNAYAIGLTGWDYVNKTSPWVGYDIDSIIGHKQGLDNEDLNKTIEALRTLKWVSILRSTGGNGYHCYVHLSPDSCPCINNHSEHISLARAILDKMCSLSGLDLKGKIDGKGLILWVWHKKQAHNAYEVVKKATDELTNIPSNWKDYRREKRNYNRSSNFDFSDDSHPLDNDHLRLIHWLEEQGYSHWWDNEKSLLVCHTYNLKEAHSVLKLKGFFNTKAEGDSGAITGQDHNCFCVPIDCGGWIVRRFGDGDETNNWLRDSSGYNRCFLNTYLSISVCEKINEGVRISDKETEFIDTTVFHNLGIQDELPPELNNRTFTIKKLAGEEILVTVPRQDGDIFSGWSLKKDKWHRVFTLPRGSTAQNIRIPHHQVRHVVCNGMGQGWYIYSNNQWIEEKRTDVISYLKGLGYNPGVTETIIGKAVNQHWTLVNCPFEPEYLGKRQWNKHAPQLAYQPTEGSHPTWDSVLSHLGSSLTLSIKENEWCKVNLIQSGKEYLFLWCAYLFQQPQQPLPYLFFYGPQNTGKSTFWEALKLLLRNGYGCASADLCLSSNTQFNSELNGAILCVVEETDVNSTMAYSRIKDWVTSSVLNIRALYKSPTLIPNTTHWVQCGNDIDECPIFPGDTRITALYVGRFEKEIIKTELIAELKKEAGAFTHSLLTHELPHPAGRLLLPIIDTGEKQDAAYKRETVLETFIRCECQYAPGDKISFKDFYQSFSQWTSEEMSKIAVSKALPPEYPRGRITGDPYVYIGNIAWKGTEIIMGKKYQRIGEKILIDD